MCYRIMASYVWQGFNLPLVGGTGQQHGCDAVQPHWHAAPSPSPGTGSLFLLPCIRPICAKGLSTCCHTHTHTLPPRQAYAEEVEVAEAAPVVEAQHWVQCSRCETWRVVPDEHWPRVEADEREDWFCEDAWWDIATMEPFTGPCEKQ